MKVRPDTRKKDTPLEALSPASWSCKDMSSGSDDYKRLFLHGHLQDDLALPPFCKSASRSGSTCRGAECVQPSDGLCNGSTVENVNCVTMEVSEDSRSSPGTCSSNTVDDDEDDGEDDDDDDEDLTPEVQQAYRMFHSFLLDKHKALTAPFWRPIGSGERGGNDMSFKRIDDKFVNRQYESITEFVADFRLMLENCYRFHGVDHWISKQAQKLEIILEQKLTLLSRTLREKTTLAVTSRGRFGTEDEKGPAGTSTRRRSVPRNLAAITVGGCESIMVQALRLEEQQRAKEEKRQRELEKKEAEEASAKEVEEWERCLLSQAEPWPINTMWELPAIGHFLCLAQTALNLPEIVFFELERCMLMPRCSSFLAKVMTSLLCQPHRRATLHRRPALPYRRWEAELRQKVLGWYQEVGRAEDQVARAEQLGLCHQFFWTLGETSPLENTAFHLLPFNQRIWLLKGLCDNVYETQKCVQDAVLGQPIHECRESILGYDSQENTYIHFPHFCGADLRIYCQSPCAALGFPLPPFHVKKLKREVAPSDFYAAARNYLGHHPKVKEEDDDSTSGDLEPWINEYDSPQEMGASSEEMEPGPKRFLFPYKEEPPSPESVKEELLKVQQRVKLKEDENEAEEDVSDSEPGNNYNLKFSPKSSKTDTINPFLLSIPNTAPKDGPPYQDRGPCPKCSLDLNPEHCSCFCVKADINRTLFSQQASCSGAETGIICSKKKKRKKKKEKSAGVKAGTGKLGLKKVRQARSTLHKAATASVKQKDKRRKRKMVGRRFDSKKETEKEAEPPQLSVEPKFKLVCTSLDELRDLISKTEDELDELESTKKRCGRWYLKRESVKELHITLIRLLNELLPWEPKLLKAFHRNRARLKKESDDFRKHPECENFIREEWRPTEGCKKGFTVEVSRESEDEDKLERTLRGDSGVTECENQHESLGRLIRGPEPMPSLSESGPLSQGVKRLQSGGLEEDLQSSSKRGKFSDSVIPEPVFEVTSRELNTARANSPTTECASAVTTPLGTVPFQRNCKPIQALLAKSVGNKVTLMSHPQATAMAQALRLPNKVVSAAVPATEPATSCQLTPRSAPVTTQAQTPTTSSASSNPVQVVYNMSEGLSLVRKDGTPLKLSVQPVVDQKTGEKLLQQVIILPSNLLIQSEETRAQQGSALSPTVILSGAPGFTVPENRIPVQQVAPLKDTIVSKTHSPCVSPGLQKVAQSVPGSKKTTPEPHSTSPTSTHPNKCDAKQELKTVCIRDSQSILVTTRGGNTGVVKVQTSDQSGATSLPASPVFTLPPQFQAFLVSKSSAVANAQAPTTTTTAKTLPSISALNEQGNSLKPLPQVPLKCVSAVNPSLLGERTCGTNVGTTPVVDNRPKVAQMISINSQCPAPSQSSAGVSSTVKAPQGIPQTPTFKSIIRSPLKRVQASGVMPEQATFPKVFLVAPTPNIPPSTTPTVPTSPSAGSGSRVLFMSQSSSACSTVIFPGSSEPSTATASSLELNLVQGTGSTASGTRTNVQGINISGLTARKVDEATVTSKNLPPQTSSGLVFVQQSNPTSCPSLDIKGPLKVAGSTDGKTVTFSTYGIGHMASSALLSATDQKNAPYSLPNVLTTKSESVIGSTAPNLAKPSTVSLIHKDVALPRGLVTKPWAPTSASFPVKLPEPRVSAAPISGTQSPAPQPGLTSVVRAPVTGSNTVQEKVVITTNAPLAPGTQLLINNMRFVVPAQGLGPGSHVLLISSPAGPVGMSPLPPVPRATGTSNLPPQMAVVQGPRMVAPGTHRMPVPLPVGTTAKIGTVLSSGQQTGIVRLSSFSAPEGKGHCVVSSESSLKDLAPHSQRCVVTKSGLQTEPQLISRTSTIPRMSSTLSRMQTLPVATVPPIGGTISSSQATAIATIPPSVNTVIMAGRGAQSGNLRLPVVITSTSPVQGKAPVHVSNAHPLHAPSKLLVSPDGAILNVVRCPGLQTVPLMQNTVTTQVVVPTCGGVTGPGLNSQRILTVNPNGPNL